MIKIGSKNDTSVEDILVALEEQCHVESQPCGCEESGPKKLHTGIP